MSKPKDIGKKSEATKKVKIKRSHRKPMNEAQKATQFQKGNKLGGRPKGSRSAFAETFLKDFLADWENHGVDAIVACREQDPVAYIKVAASLLPKELNIKDGQATLDRMLEKLDDTQLDKLIDGLIALGAGDDAATSDDPQVAPKARNLPDRLH